MSDIIISESNFSKILSAVRSPEIFFVCSIDFTGYFLGTGDVTSNLYIWGYSPCIRLALKTWVRGSEICAASSLYNLAGMSPCTVDLFVLRCK